MKEYNVFHRFLPARKMPDGSPFLLFYFATKITDKHTPHEIKHEYTN